MAIQTDEQNCRSELPGGSGNLGTEIMCTLPAEAASNYQVVVKLLESGMNIARIDCALQDKELWLKMIHNLRRGSSALKKTCKILMQLQGQTPRIGEFLPHTSAIKIDPLRNEKGLAIKNVRVRFVYGKCTGKATCIEIPIEKVSSDNLTVNDMIYLRDAAGRSRKLEITGMGKNYIEAESNKSVYLESGIRLMFLRRSEITGHATICQMPESEMQVRLFTNDEFILTPPGTFGQPAIRDDQNRILEPVRISCSNDDIFTLVSSEERILFGDGKLEGLIKNVTARSIKGTVIRAPQKGVELSQGQTIHFPDIPARIPPLSETDYGNLAFAMQHADMIGLPCIEHPEELKMIYTFLGEISSVSKPLFLPVETASGYQNLNSMLEVANKKAPLGLLFSPFKISCELGFERFSEVQESVLLLATQTNILVAITDPILQKMCKQGIPSPCEINTVIHYRNANILFVGEGNFTAEAIRLTYCLLSLKNT